MKQISKENIRDLLRCEFLEHHRLEGVPVLALQVNIAGLNHRILLAVHEIPGLCIQGQEEAEPSKHIDYSGLSLRQRFAKMIGLSLNGKRSGL